MGTSNFDTSLDDFTDVPDSGEIVDSDRIRTMIDAIKKGQAKLGVSGSTVSTSHDFKLARLAEIGPIINVKEFGCATTNTAAANTTAVQNIVNFVTAFGQAAVIYFPQGTYDINNITVAGDFITFAGAGNRVTILNYKGSSSGAAFLSFTGTESGPPGRLEENRVFDIKLKNGGNAFSTGIQVDSASHAIYERVIFSAFRKNAIRGSYYMDAEINECQFDFCGSANDSDNAAVYIGEGCNSLRFVNCRFENTTDRTLHLTKGAGSTNKIRFYGCKFESSTADGNGMGGTDSQFYLDGVAFVAFTACDFTFQRLQNGTHAIVPALFHVQGSSAISFADCYFPNGSLGAVKPFTSYFWMDGSSAANTACSWSNCVFTSGNAASPPTQTFLWAGTNRKISRSGVSWGFVSGGGTPTMDSGSPTSASDL